jgi:hypothetical protein
LHVGTLENTSALLEDNLNSKTTNGKHKNVKNITVIGQRKDTYSQ